MKKFNIVFCGLFLALSMRAFAFDTEAKYAILMDYDTGEILYSKDADTRMVPSSMSKLMTVYIIFEQLRNGSLKLDDKFTVSENAWRKQGSKMFLNIGEEVSVENLLRGIIVVSGNDACITVAENLAGSEEEFSKMLNEKAQEIGLVNSNFVNSTGWPDEDHVMSSYDLAVLTRRLIHDFPEYYHYFSEKDFTYNNIRQDNRNNLLNKNLGVDGLKTGHTEVAGLGVVISAKQNGRRLIAVINGLNNNSHRSQEGEKLLRFGFLQFSNKKLFEENGVVSNIYIKNGAPDNLPIITKGPIILTLPNNNK